MSEVVEGATAVEQDRPPEPAGVLDYEERLRIARRIVTAMKAAGIDCAVAKPPWPQ